MSIQPSIHLEIARQRQQDLLARSERHRLATTALAGRPEARGLAPAKTQAPADFSSSLSALIFAHECCISSSVIGSRTSPSTV
jgi:hypothetical protein